MMAEVTAESLPNSLSRGARGGIGKIIGALSGVLAGAQKGTGLFTACNAIDHNFMTQEDEFLIKQEQKEEELEHLLALFSPLTQAAQGVYQDLFYEEQTYTFLETQAYQESQAMIGAWSDIADEVSERYSSFGDLIETKQKSDDPQLKALDTRGRERAREGIYPHRRSKSPPRLKTTVIEEGKTFAKTTIVRMTPEVIKEMLPYIVTGVKESLTSIGEHIPGAKLVRKGGLILLQGLERSLDVLPTGMRRTARAFGLPQNWAQNIGDMAHLLQDIALIVVPTIKVIRGEKISSRLLTLENDQGSYLKYWTKTETYTFNGQTNKVYKRDDLIDLNKVDEVGRTNLQRMHEGLAPYGPDNKSMELHHTIQTKDSKLAEVTHKFHKRNTKIIHINPKTTPSGIPRGDFNKWREKYWQERAKEFLGKGDIK